MKQEKKFQAYLLWVRASTLTLILVLSFPRFPFLVFHGFSLTRINKWKQQTIKEKKKKNRFFYICYRWGFIYIYVIYICYIYNIFAMLFYTCLYFIRIRPYLHTHIQKNSSSLSHFFLLQPHPDVRGRVAAHQVTPRMVAVGIRAVDVSVGHLFPLAGLFE